MARDAVVVTHNFINVRSRWTVGLYYLVTQIAQRHSLLCESSTLVGYTLKQRLCMTPFTK